MEERHTKRACLTHPVSAEGRKGVSSFLQSWAWKREHRPDRDRFQRPYVHTLNVPGGIPGGGGTVKLTVEQARFGGAQGFASTVWDSSIVVAKFLERNPALVSGRAVLDLSAGCGLVALVAARLGARRAVATDLPSNLPLLRRNCERNGADVEVLEHWWGSDVSSLVHGGNTSGSGGGIDLVVACDVMYLEDAVGPLVASLAALCGGRYDIGDPAAGDTPSSGAPAAESDTAHGPAGRPALSAGTLRTSASNDCIGGDGDGDGDGGTVVLLAHGRNRFAEVAFWRHAAAAGFGAAPVTPEELDPVYRCSDVDVYRMRLISPAAAGRRKEGGRDVATAVKATEVPAVQGGLRDKATGSPGTAAVEGPGPQGEVAGSALGPDGVGQAGGVAAALGKGGADSEAHGAAHEESGGGNGRQKGKRKSEARNVVVAGGEAQGCAQAAGMVPEASIMSAGQALGSESAGRESSRGVAGRVAAAAVKQGVIEKTTAPGNPGEQGAKCHSKGKDPKGTR